MQVSALLHVSKEDFTLFIRKMIYEDIVQSTKQDAIQRNGDEICEGYQYEKKVLNRMQKYEPVKVCIEQLKDGIYEASFESAQGKNSLSYRYEKKGDYDIEVTYEETYYGVNTSTEISFKFFSLLTKRSNKKRMMALLKQIEKTIQEGA